MYVNNKQKSAFPAILDRWLTNHDESALQTLMSDYIRPIVHGAQCKFQYPLACEEDAIEDAVTHIAMRLDRVDPSGEWFSWMTRCARFHLIDQLRKEKTYEKHVDHYTELYLTQVEIEAQEDDDEDQDY